jgi:hypothetical protein
MSTNNGFSPRELNQIRRIILDNLGLIVAAKWNTVVNSEPRIINLVVTEDSITARLADGRTISVPLAWSWRLSNATPEQRNNFQLFGDGEGAHWPDIDEDISARGMLHGARPVRPSAKRFNYHKEVTDI